MVLFQAKYADGNLEKENQSQSVRVDVSESPGLKKSVDLSNRQPVSPVVRLEIRSEVNQVDQKSQISNLQKRKLRSKP